ncbi:hypothetical protein WMF11_48835 [Sorangium sp. So ce295]|jgi:hypothetical protein|uniref:hypothetical protein n=1 Tax=Sorangium sp. So ce295 TaxID=3133295 RepID=UPI003F5E911A
MAALELFTQGECMSDQRGRARRDDKAIDTSREEAVDPGLDLPIAAFLPVMEQPLPPFDPSNLSRYVWREIDESSRPLLARLDPGSRRAYERLGRVPGPRRYELGSFQIDEHRFVSFEAIPAFGEVSYSEIAEVPPGSTAPPEKVRDGDSPSPLMRFLQLTDRSVPVPLVLRELDDESDAPEVERALEGRDVVDSLADLGRPADLRRVDLRAALEAAASVCSDAGDDVFSGNYCQSKGIWHCDSAARTKLTRGSGSKRRKVSHSIIAACNGSTRLEHLFRHWDFWNAKWTWQAVYYNDGKWHQQIPSGRTWYWQHVGSRKRRREIRIEAFQGYFRAWTAFYN